MFEKMSGESKDIMKDHVEKLKQLFPEVVSEGQVDFDKLKDILTEVDPDEIAQDERYNFTWSGKRKSIHIAQQPSKGTLRPVKEKSKNWDKTKNLYIEGDNLEVLKLLQKSYFQKVKIIYIDPPYNTGNDFVYKDDYKDGIENYLEQTGQVDSDGNKVSTNAESNGRFHSDWLNMMYPRLKIARNLLKDDGVIFISIDDNEMQNLRNICDEVFGASNFVASLVWEKKKKGAFLSKHYINMKEYIVVYAKNGKSFEGLVGEINNNAETYPCIKQTNARGIRTIKKGTTSKYREKNYFVPANTRISSGNMELIYLDDVVITNGVLQEDVRIDSNWIYSQAKLDEYATKQELYITQDLYIRRIVTEDRTKMLKDLLLRVGSDGKSLPSFSLDTNLNNGGWGTNEDANDELHQLLGVQNLFDFTKPSRLIGKLIQSIYSNDFIVLDFFSGSATTAHATIQLNAEDNGNRKYIMVQLEEPVNEKSEAYKAGYRTICDIGEERIRRAGEKIRQELAEKREKEGMLSKTMNPEDLDIGFKVFKLDRSNIREWYADFDHIDQQLDLFENNFVKGRSEEDIVYEIMLKSGLDLNFPIEKINFHGKNIYNIAYGALFICLDDEITVDIADKLVELKNELNPEKTRVVFKDLGFKDDQTKINVYENLKSNGFEELLSI